MEAGCPLSPNLAARACGVPSNNGWAGLAVPVGTCTGSAFQTHSIVGSGSLEAWNPHLPDSLAKRVLSALYQWEAQVMFENQKRTEAIVPSRSQGHQPGVKAGEMAYVRFCRNSILLVTCFSVKQLRSSAVVSCSSCDFLISWLHWQLSLTFLSPSPAHVLEAPVLKPLLIVTPRVLSTFLAEGRLVETILRYEIDTSGSWT